MKSEHFPLTLYPTHNLRVRSKLDGLAWEGCKVVYNMLRQSPLGYAISAYIWIHPTLLQEFWWRAETIFRGTKKWIRSTVLDRVIILSKETLRVSLQLNEDIDATFFTRETLDQTLKEIGYHTPNRSRQISRSGFIPPYLYLVTQLGVCYSRKHGHFNELSYRLMEMVHAVVQEKPYNFSKYLMRDLEENIHTHQPYLIYPRFVMKVITSQLDFGGVTNWYPRVQVVLQEDLNIPSLVPTNQHTGRTTYLWMYASLIYDD
ncbi:hypothetical protein Hanom_Chr16g01447731 [Helianthus anomalus]